MLLFNKGPSAQMYTEPIKPSTVIGAWNWLLGHLGKQALESRHQELIAQPRWNGGTMSADVEVARNPATESMLELLSHLPTTPSKNIKGLAGSLSIT